VAAVYAHGVITVLCYLGIYAVVMLIGAFFFNKKSAKA